MSTTSPPRRTRSDSAKTAKEEMPRDREAAASAKETSATSGQSVIAESSTPKSGHSALSADIVREIYLTRPDGLASFYDGGAPKEAAKSRVAALLGTVAELKSTDPENASSIRKLLKQALRRDGKPTTEKHGRPKPAAAYHSEADRLSILRTDWSDEGVQVAVDWSQPELRIEMFIGSRAVLAGGMAPRVRAGGSPCEPIGTWEEICWESNVDVDYLELEIDLTGGVRLQRQIILTRRDGALFVADAVLAPTSTKLNCETALPLVAGCDFTPAEETREATAVIGKQRLLFLPLALGEWRTESCSGDLTFEAGQLRLRQQAAQADALYVPLAVIYDRKRAKRECTWRRLTVGENLRLVPPGEACGYRWQLGKEHWLAYRSLTEHRANRTVLGINLQTNFLLSRFTTGGESEPLVEIDD